MLRVKITKLMYGWSKWGGGNKGLVKEELDEWACQNCGETQRKGLPSYMVESAEREFMRICSKCKHEMIKKNLKTYWQLGRTSQRLGEIEKMLEELQTS